MSDLLKQQRDYAWNYFQVHAAQRMTTFNFFVILAGLLTAGLARISTDNGDFRILSLFLGISLIIVAFSFWQLDKRVRYLISLAELKLRDIERLAKEESGWTVTIFIEENNNDHNSLKYTGCFNIVYLTFAMLGFFGVFFYYKCFFSSIF